jgi:2-polyprenyl-3-methyl-5-hydroxy-6-metoxy-1,4-benzoquinol methylase
LDNSSKHWDSVFREQRIIPPATNDPVLAAALEHFGGGVANCRLLDIGCGLGEASLFFADRGAQVVSIDNSDVAISALREYSSFHNITNLIPHLMDATKIGDIGPFDFIFGRFILHHIEPFDEFAPTLRAALRPGGKAFFYENSAASSLLMWFRKNVVGRVWVPKHSDEEEYPLTPGEIRTLSKYFHTEVVYPELVFFRLISSYLFRGKGSRPFIFLDNLLYRVPRFRRYSYRQYIMLS